MIEKSILTRAHILSIENSIHQVRSDSLKCTFRASCCSACLSRAQVSAFTGSSVWDKRKKGAGNEWGGGGGLPALAGTREYQQSDRV